jgi:ESCRT-II complex subunit VPS36
MQDETSGSSGLSRRRDGTGDIDGPLFESWECEVCAHRNPPGLSPAAAKICALCGVPRDKVPPPIQSATPSAVPSKLKASSSHLSSSLPSSRSPIASRVEGEDSEDNGANITDSDTIACLACTFLNHRYLRECEICGTSLPRPSRSSQTRPATMKSAPGSRTHSVGPDDEDEDFREGMIKLSFRKGGDKAFYSVLKRSLLGKAWEVRMLFVSNMCCTNNLLVERCREGF